MIAQFVEQHPFITLVISHAFVFTAGYLLSTVRNGFKAAKLWDEWVAAEEDPLTKEYLQNPIRDAVIPREEDDWDAYQRSVRPLQTTLATQVGAWPRSYDVYLEKLPTQRLDPPAEAPVSPAMVAYWGTPNYVPRHSAEGRTEAQVRALNTATGSFPAINWDEGARVLCGDWRENAEIPETKELVLV